MCRGKTIRYLDNVRTRIDHRRICPGRGDRRLAGERQRGSRKIYCLFFPGGDRTARNEEIDIIIPFASGIDSDTIRAGNYTAVNIGRVLQI